MISHQRQVQNMRAAASVEEPVGPLVVAMGDEAVELALKLLLGCHPVPFGEELLHGLVPTFDLATGLGMVGTRVLIEDALTKQFTLKDRAALARDCVED